MKKLKPLIPLLALVLIILILYLLDTYTQLNLDFFKEKRQELFLWSGQHPILSPFLFVVVYLFSVCLIIPDSTILSLGAGMIYSFPLALFLVCLSETLGAILFFFIIRFAFSARALEKRKAVLKPIEKQFLEDQTWYMLFFRFSHLLPFWVINFFAAVFETKIWTFVWTTFIGVLPLSFLLVQAGSGLKKIFDAQGSFSMHEILNTETKCALIGLGILALGPMIIKKFFFKKTLW